jgi:ribosomal protein L14
MVDSVSNSSYPGFLQGDMSKTSELQSEATKRLIEEYKNADRKFESVDVAKNPSKYTAEQKLIMFLDLLQSKANYGGYTDAVGKHYEWWGADADKTAKVFLRTHEEIKADFERAISSLEADKDMQALLNKRIFQEIKEMLLEGKNPETYAAFKQNFGTNVVSGKMLTDGLAAGESVKDILDDYSTALYFYSQVLSDADFKSKAAEANKNYSEFLKENLLDNTSPVDAIDDLLNRTDADSSALDKFPGLGSVLPVVADNALGNTVFGDGLFDKNLMKTLSGQMELFEPTVKLLAQQMFGDNKAAADAFTAKVMELLPSLWDKVANGEISARDFQGHFERLLQGIDIPAGVNAADFKTSIKEAVIALIQGGALVSQAQPTDVGQPLVVRDANGNFVRQSGLNTYSKDEIAAMIAAATGLAGRSQASGNSTAGESRYDSDPKHTAEIDRKLFGTEKHAWDGAVSDTFAFNDVKTAAATVTELVKDRAPDFQITDPTPVRGSYGFDSVLPTMADSGLATTVFGDNLYNGKLMEWLSGKTELFRPTVEMLANQAFGDNKTAADAFIAKVMEILPSLWDKMAKGEMSARDFEGHFDRLLQGIKVPDGVSAADFKAAIKDAVQALIQGGAVVSQAQPTDVSQPLVVRDANGNFVRQSGLNTYSDSEIAAMIAAATGLAGRSITDTRIRYPEGRAGTDESYIATVDKKMFGTEGKGWDKAMLDAFAFKDVKTASETLTDFVANNAGDYEVTRPKAVPSLDSISRAKNLASILDPTISAMAEELFKDNLPAQKQFKLNIMSIVTSVWGMFKPGGDFSTLGKLLREKMQVEITPPPGVSKNKYYDALLDGANALVNGAVVGYRSTTGRNATPDALAATVFYATTFVGKALSGTGNFLSSVEDIGKMFKNSTWSAKASTMFAADTLKMAASAISGAIGLGWIGLDIFWTIDAKRNGADALEVSMLSVATVADAVVGFGTVISTASKALQYALPELAGALSFTRTFSTVTGIASLVSNAVWLAITMYADIKESREFDKLTNRMSDETERLLDDPILFNGPRPPVNPPDWSPW